MTSEPGHGSDSELDRYIYSPLKTHENCTFPAYNIYLETTSLFPLSDDDLTPYDMSADQEKKKSAPPRYVRDCLEGDLKSK